MGQSTTGCLKLKLPYNFSTHPHSDHTTTPFNSNHAFWGSLSRHSQTLVEWRALKVSKQPINVTMLRVMWGGGQHAEKNGQVVHIG